MQTSKSRSSLIPPFNADRQLKSDLSSSMWGDANDLLWRAEMSLVDPPSYSKAFLAKVFVDILMSVESSLKSLIVSLSIKEESPEAVYILVLRFGHNISNLYQEVERRSNRRFKLLTLNDKIVIEKATKLKVSNRYKLNTMLMLSEEEWIDRELGRGTVSSLLNFEFIREFNRVAHILHQMSLDCKNKYCDNKGMLGKNVAKYRNRQETFYTYLKETRNFR